MSKTASGAVPTPGAVAHMKWWGWGVEGLGFHHEDKPKFAPFVLNAVGLDLATAQPAAEPAFADVVISDPILPEALREALVLAAGVEAVTNEPMLRAIHTYGKSLRDLVRMRQRLVQRWVDVVVYPKDESEVQAVVRAVVDHDAVLIPFGGGSNIAGSLEPLADERRPVISLDMGRMRRVLDIDTDSGLARIEAGALGPDLEEQLASEGWTLGHFPDSFTHSSIGGWAATRSSGMQSDKYGDIADIVRGMRVARPGGILEIRAVPSASNGPSVREMLIGSEGRLGVITELTVQVHRIPAERRINAYFFGDWATGVKAMQAIAESDAAPSITRVSDARETGFSLATSKGSHGLAKLISGTVIPKMMKSKGWDLEQICLSFIGFEGSREHVKRTKSLVDDIVKEHGGFGVGTGPGVLYDQKKFDTPYLRDFLLDRGAAGDVSETATSWSKLLPLYEAVVAAAQRSFDEIGRKGWIMCHLSHSYHSGACLYFTFAFVFGDDPLGEYDRVKSAIQQAFVDNGGSISHHHGVGLEHAPWIAEDISPEAVAVMRGLFTTADPGENFNPGKVLLRD